MSLGARSYEPVADIARGGMGRVELVVRREGEFARVYAMKRLHPDLIDDAEVRDMFLTEARIAGLIRHPNVVPVLDVGEDEIGPFLVMEYIEGVPAWMPIVRARDRGERLPVGLCVEIVRQAALGLDAAHELVGAGGKALAVVHRDVSPHNVLLGFDGLVRVTDFGVARAVDHGQRTRVGMLKGKAGYMAPEQIAYEKLDARADLFALGVVAFELLAGRRLYPGTPEDAFERIREELPPDVRDDRPEVPAGLAELVERMLSKAREDRPASSADVAAQLEAAAAALDEPSDPKALAAYLTRAFADERERMRSLATQALERTDVEAPLPPPAAGVMEADTAIVAKAAGPRRARTRIAWWIGAAVVVIAVLAVWIVRAVMPGTATGTGTAASSEPGEASTEPATSASSSSEPGEASTEPATSASSSSATAAGSTSSSPSTSTVGAPSTSPSASTMGTTSTSPSTSMSTVGGERTRDRRRRREARRRAARRTEMAPAEGALSMRAWGWDEGSAP